MKRIFITTIMLLLANLLTSNSASAQGEWKWAHCWSGNDGLGTTSYYNRIYNTAFDDEGNLYVYGKMGGDAAMDGDRLWFCENSSVVLLNCPTVLLAKFDTMGNMLWYKVIKSSTTMSRPKWMEVRDNKVYISGDLAMDNGMDYPSTMNSVWIYYLDTLVLGSQIHAIPHSERVAPFKTGRWTFFATLDTDGNLLEDHFVEVISREIHNGVHGKQTLTWSSGGDAAPFHVDGDGNVYFYTQFHYRGSESEPYRIVVDGDNSRTYEVYFPGSIDSSEAGNAAFRNAILYKFSSDWRLVRAKLLIDHTEGILPSWINGGDTISGLEWYFCDGLSYDEEDNMYLSGFVVVTKAYPNVGGMNHHYPIYVYWDSTHRLTIHDITSAANGNFLIKYDTAGNVVWCNQIHTRGIVTTDGVTSADAFWYGNTFYDNSIYVAGYGRSYLDGYSLVYFDNVSHPLERYTELPVDSSRTEERGFFVRYDCNTGNYISQGIVPAIRARPTMKVGVLHNRVFANSLIGLPFDKNAFTIWRNDGYMISHDTLSGTIDNDCSAGCIANERGYVVTALISKGPIHFSNSVEANCYNGNSTATFAMYHNPDFTEPYVGVPDRHISGLSVKVWPNPTVETLQVECGEAILESVAVLDLSGRTLLHQSVGDYQSQIKVSQLPAGMYLLKIVSDGRTQYEKFVKSATSK